MEPSKKPGSTFRFPRIALYLGLLLTVFSLSGCFDWIISFEEVAVESVVVTPPTLDLMEGEEGYLTADVVPSNATNTWVYWESSNPAVASVDFGGLVTALSPGETVIMATSEDGGFSDSSVVTVVANNTPPDTPVGLTVNTPTTSSLKIVWNAVSRATGYKVFRDLSSSGSFTNQVYSGSATNFSDIGLSSGTTYYYKVLALNAYGQSSLSSYASNTTATPVGNLAPVISGIYSQTPIGPVDSFVEFTVYGDDPEGQTLTILWEFEVKPLGSLATLSDAVFSTAGFTPDLAGDYVLRATLSDGTQQTTATISFTAFDSTQGGINVGIN